MGIFELMVTRDVGSRRSLRRHRPFAVPSVSSARSAHSARSPHWPAVQSLAARQFLPAVARSRSKVSFMRRANGTIQIFTFKEGVLSAVAHDLRIRLESFAVTLDGTAV